ncbi:aminotransferase class I/II-fold pyridoxal phosphate-dependent enzyme [bacterium]|nr:aminotransferase class I/II-fold pyridoxal phosphate-dependent enzyme [bacterium]
MPRLSTHIANRKPTAIRRAGLLFAERRDGCESISVAEGNVSLPMHPAMIKRLHNLNAPGSPFSQGVVRYTQTVGLPETREAFKKVIRASGCDTEGLNVQITSGGSQAMELLTIACSGKAGDDDMPLLLIDAAYTNYRYFAKRLGRRVFSFPRRLNRDGQFTLPDIEEIEDLIQKERPNALVVIPYDNPTGQLYTQEMMVSLAKLCVKYDMWMISDEAYRELYYVEGGRAVSIWNISEEEVPGLRGLRVSIETASKVWNGCGLRLGALVTDNAKLYSSLLAENTVNLCTNAISQYIFGALNELSLEELQAWFVKQRGYYKPLIKKFSRDMYEALPGVILGSTDASLYTVVDFRDLVNEKFCIEDFVVWCASEGFVEEDGKKVTVLCAPMPEFYNAESMEENLGRTQVRIAFIEKPEKMARIPGLLGKLFTQYLNAHPELKK